MMMSYVAVSQHEVDRHHSHAVERLRLRGHDATAMRATIVRAGGVVAARAHVMAILVLTDWSIETIFARAQ